MPGGTFCAETSKAPRLPSSLRPFLKVTSEDLNAYAEPLKAKGPKSRAAIELLLHAHREFPDRFLTEGRNVFELLHDALRSWDDEDIATIIEAVLKDVSSGLNVQAIELAGWIQAHIDDEKRVRATNVVHCLQCRPPKEFRVLRVLSIAGYEKIVFKATWNAKMRNVALKKLIRLDGSSSTNELFAHGLSVNHPNIIETFPFKTDDGSMFFAEELLPDIIREDQDLGQIEIANLLRDMLNAASSLESEEYIHGDIKPDNIGRSHSRYLLLDFGTCQSAEKPTKATGSYRTRAPEVLLDEMALSFASDIWAIGATVFRLLCKRFPLLTHQDTWPAHADVSGRHRVLELLQSRAKSEYTVRIKSQEIPEPFRQVLTRMLAEKPNDRGTARELLGICEQTLGAYLRTGTAPRAFSPMEELACLSEFLTDEPSLALMSYDDRRTLHATLQRIERSPALGEDGKAALEALRRRLPGDAK